MKLDKRQSRALPGSLVTREGFLLSCYGNFNMQFYLMVQDGYLASRQQEEEGMKIFQVYFLEIVHDIFIY